LSIDNYSIDYTLNKDGLVNVSEKLQYTLTGCYTELYLQKPTSLNILNASGFCENKDCSFRHDLTGTPTGDQELVLKSSYCDETVNVNFSYDLSGVINELQDGNFQFYYFLYGKDTAYPTNLYVSLTAPGDLNQSEYFIHSKDYSIEIKKNQMSIFKPVIANEPIEINLLMPKEWFTKTEYIKSDNFTVSEVKILEKDWNKDYESYINSITPFSKSKKITIIIFSLLIPILGFFLIWRRYGKEISREKINFFEEYQRELPFKEHDPLIANYYVSEKFSKNWFSSAIMYLVWKGVYILEKEEDDYFLKRTDKKITLPKYIFMIDSFLSNHFLNYRFNVNEIKRRLTGSISLTSNVFDQYVENKNFQKEFLELHKTIKSDYDELFYNNKNEYDKKGVKIYFIFNIS